MDKAKEYKSLTDAAEENNISIGKLSVAVDQRINKSSGGYFWFTSKELATEFTFYKTPRKNCKIIAYDLNGELCGIYDSQTHAEKETGVKSRQINKCLKQESKKQTGGYQWFYHDENHLIKIDKWIDSKLKIVCQYNKNGEFIKQYTSIKKASECLKISQASIGSCCNKKLKSAGGYQWCFIGDKDNVKVFKKEYNLTKVLQFTIENIFIKEWESIKEAANELKIHSGGISACCRKKTNMCGNYKWRYKN